MEPAAAHRETSGKLAHGPAKGLDLATNTLPVGAVKPWFGIGFHCGKLSTGMGVFTKIQLALLGMRASIPRLRPKQNHPALTDLMQHFSEDEGAYFIERLGQVAPLSTGGAEQYS